MYCKKKREMHKAPCSSCNTTEKEKQNEDECKAAGGKFQTGWVAPYPKPPSYRLWVYDSCEYS